jgi:hypothetical protein
MRVKPYIVNMLNLSVLMDEKVDKPGSVPLARWPPFFLDYGYPQPLRSQPGTSRHDHRSLLEIAPPALSPVAPHSPASRMGLVSVAVTRLAAGGKLATWVCRGARTFLSVERQPDLLVRFIIA